MCMIVADESLRADMLTIMTDDNVDRGLQVQRFRERDKESGSADSPVSGSPVPAPTRDNGTVARPRQFPVKFKNYSNA